MAKFYRHTVNGLVPIDTEKADKEYVDGKINDLQNSIDDITDVINVDSSDNKFIITDTNGNIGLMLDERGLSVKDVTAGEHTLSEKADRSEVNKKLNRDEFEEVISVAADNVLVISDANGNIGLQLNSDGLSVKDVTAGEHTLSEKADQSEVDSVISTVSSSISSLTSSVNKNSTDISSLTTRVSTNESNIDKKLDKDDFEEVISIEEDNEFIISDTNGNIGFKLDSTGAKAKDFTTSDYVSLSGVNDDLNDAISRLSTIEGLLEEDGNEVIDNLKDVIDYFNGVKETDTGAALLSNVASHTSQISNLTDSVNKNTNNITTNTTNIASLSTRVGETEVSITELSGTVDSYSSTIASLTETVNSNTTNISKKLDRIEFTEVINVDGGSGEFVIADENGNIGLKLNNSEGLTAVKDVIVKDNDTTHVLSQKADKTYVEGVISTVSTSIGSLTETVNRNTTNIASLSNHINNLKTSDITNDSINNITNVSATIDNNVGIPNVTTSLSGDGIDKVLNFNFENIKGEPGSSAKITEVSSFTHTDEDNKETRVGVSLTGDDMNRGFTFNFYNIKGENGKDGTDGTSITITSLDQKEGEGETSTVTFSDGKSLYIKNGKDGTDGTDGTSITITSLDQKEGDGETSTVTFSDGNELKIKNGTNGTSITITSLDQKDGEGETSTVTFSDGKELKIKNGTNGINGTNGKDGTDGNSVKSIHCVNGEHSEEFKTIDPSPNATNYYRIKDTDNNWLEGAIAVTNGTPGIGGGSGDSNFDALKSIKEDTGENLGVSVTVKQELGLITEVVVDDTNSPIFNDGDFFVIADKDNNIGLKVDSEGVKSKDFFTSSDVSLNDVGDRLSVVEDSIGVELITYDNLVQLRNDKLLIPGKKYRITDYVTTTSQENTLSAGHKFDIIVTALTENELSEIASACYHNYNYGLITLEKELYISEFNSINGWDGVGCTFSQSIRNRLINNKSYIEYVDKNNNRNRLYFDFNDKSKVYFDSDDVIKFIPSYYIAPDYGYNDLTENNVSLLGDDGFYVPYISTYDNMVDGNETQISISIRKEFNRNYFKNLGCNLSAWKIWYSLDNNSDRFAWADVENGKGVIYRMIDEWGNDCPYDFKNIQFSKTIDDETITSYTFSWRKKYIIYADTNTPGISGIKRIDIKDTSIAGNNGLLLDDKGNIPGVHNNVIKSYTSGNKQYLNNICFCSSFDYDGYYHMCINNSFGNDCYNNSFGNDCYNNIFGNDCCNNTFGDICRINVFGYGCSSNIFGDEFISNNFGDMCFGNTFGNEFKTSNFGNSCLGNTFGNGCWDITFGNDCKYNTFGNECYLNTLANGCTNIIFGDACINNTFNVGCEDFEFGSWCWNNTFGNYCFWFTFGNGFNNNYFGSNCADNTFGNNCSGNMFGNNCGYIFFGDYCKNNTLGSNCDNIIFGNSKTTLSSYYRNIIIDNNNSHINLNCTSTTSSSNYYQNVRIGLGVNNTTTIKNIDDSNVGQIYETLYKPVNSQIITI